MIRLSNGHTFEYMAASDSLGFNGEGWSWEQPLKWIGLLNPRLFTVVAKTITLQPTEGNLQWYNPFHCIRPIHNGIANAIGLSNPGIDWWCEKIKPTINSHKIPLVVSISGKPEELGKMANILNDFDLVGLEFNSSCPNTRIPNAKEIITGCEMIKNHSRLPLILKISAGQKIEKIAKKVLGLIDAFAINSVPWKIAFPNRHSPFAKFGGGAISGKAAQPVNWKLVIKLASITSIPIIVPDIWNFSDIEKVKNLGAQAVSFGSVFLRYPWRPTLFVKRDKQQKR